MRFGGATSSCAVSGNFSFISSTDIKLTTLQHPPHIYLKTCKVINTQNNIWRLYRRKISVGTTSPSSAETTLMEIYIRSVIKDVLPMENNYIPAVLAVGVILTVQSSQPDTMERLRRCNFLAMDSLAKNSKFLKKICLA